MSRFLSLRKQKQDTLLALNVELINSAIDASPGESERETCDGIGDAGGVATPPEDTKL